MASKNLTSHSPGLLAATFGYQSSGCGSTNISLSAGHLHQFVVLNLPACVICQCCHCQCCHYSNLYKFWSNLTACSTGLFKGSVSSSLPCKPRRAQLSCVLPEALPYFLSESHSYKLTKFYGLSNPESTLFLQLPPQVKKIYMHQT